LTITLCSLRQRALDAANSIADLMQEPCKGEWLEQTATKILQADIETAECLRQLRLIISLASR
jgi:hypothetical protein